MICSELLASRSSYLQIHATFGKVSIRFEVLLVVLIIFNIFGRASRDNDSPLAEITLSGSQLANHVGIRE